MRKILNCKSKITEMASVKKWRQYGKLIFASLVYFCQGATIAAVAPVVSIVSEEDRGIPSYFTGVIVGQDDVAIFFSSLLLFPYLINSSNYVKYFVLGSIGSILCNAVFAFTYKVDDDVVYVNMCLFIRLIEGCAFSSSWIAGKNIQVSFFGLVPLHLSMIPLYLDEAEFYDNICGRGDIKNWAK